LKSDYIPRSLRYGQKELKIVRENAKSDRWFLTGIFKYEL